MVVNGIYINVSEVATVEPDKRDWCKITMKNGHEIEVQAYDQVMYAVQNQPVIDAEKERLALAQSKALGLRGEQ